MKTALILSLGMVTAVCADSLQSAKITQIIKDVKVYRDQSSGRAATMGEIVSGSTSVTTGRRSRAELTFQDDTITRLGQNSVFSFRSGTREVELKRGTLLLQVPKNAGGATIRTATVTAAISGTTVLMEYNPDHWVKVITLEGSQKVFIKGNKKPVVVPAGQMIIMRPDGRVIPRPVTIDVGKLVDTSALANRKLFGRLPTGALAAIRDTVNTQTVAKRTGSITSDTPVIRNSVVRDANTSTDQVITRTLDGGNLRGNTLPQLP